MIFCLIFQAPYFLVLAISVSNRNSCKRRRRVVGIAVGVVAVVKVDFDDVVGELEALVWVPNIRLLVDKWWTLVGRIASDVGGLPSDGPSVSLALTTEFIPPY